MAAGAVVIIAVLWLISQVSETDVDYGITVIVILLLAAIAYGAVRVSRRLRKRREYNQTLLDFQWKADMSPQDFEQHCADYLRLKGWKAETTARIGDQGADVVASKAEQRIVLQCKLYSSPVGNAAVQQVIAAQAFYKANAAAVVSNQRFTSGARVLAERAGVRLLHFTDLRTL